MVIRLEKTLGVGENTLWAQKGVRVAELSNTDLAASRAGLS